MAFKMNISQNYLVWEKMDLWLDFCWLLNGESLSSFGRQCSLYRKPVSRDAMVVDGVVLLAETFK